MERVHQNRVTSHSRYRQRRDSVKATVKWPTFPYEEYRARVERAKQCLERHELDAMLLFAPTSWHYYAGFSDAAQMHNEVWRSALIVPRDGIRWPWPMRPSRPRSRRRRTSRTSASGPRSKPRSIETSRAPSTSSSSTRSEISASPVGRSASRRARRSTPTSRSTSSRGSACPRHRPASSARTRPSGPSE